MLPKLATSCHFMILTKIYTFDEPISPHAKFGQVMSESGKW
jgi:hypothetical protein